MNALLFAAAGVIEWGNVVLIGVVVGLVAALCAVLFLFYNGFLFFARIPRRFFRSGAKKQKNCANTLLILHGKAIIMGKK